MDAGAVKEIAALAPATRFGFDGREFSDKPLIEIKIPTVEDLELHTLAGLVETLEASFESAYVSAAKGLLIHVVDHRTVQVIGVRSNVSGQRLTLVESTAFRGDREFRFNEYMSVEDFNIGIRTHFTETVGADEGYITRIAGSISSEEKATIQDDGISQKVTLKSGVATLENETVKPVVTLAPYRTFREVAQPASEFLFRIRTEGKTMCALFEADGGTWKLDAVQAVQTWLQNRIKTSSIPSVASIPVIA